MDATRAEVERELKRVRNLLDMTRKEVEERKDEIRQKMTGDFEAISVISDLEFLRQSQWQSCLYFFAWRTLEDILKNTQPPAVEGEVGK
jgi:hypothetical protein